KKWLYYDKSVVEYMTRYQHIYNDMGNVLYIQGQGTNKDFSALVTDLIPNYQVISNGKGFPTYLGSDSLGRIPNYNSEFLKKVKLTEEQAFSYIYAILHHPEYLERYKNDLSKAFPRIPILKDSRQYVKVGQELVKLHLNYESVEPYSNVIIEG